MAGEQMKKLSACLIAALAAFSLDSAYGQVSGGDSQGNDKKSTSAQTPPAGANPLWGVSLSALSATRDRPIFSASRRPPAPPPPPTVAATPPPPPPAVPEQPNFALLGTAVSNTQTVALVLDQATKAIIRLHPGESASGWSLRSVDGRSMTLEKNSQVATVSLPAPGEAPAGPRMPAFNIAGKFGRTF